MASIREQMTDISVLVVGDAMLDRHIVGKVHRLSPEAPVPVVNVEGERTFPGGAAHVAASLAALGCRVTLAAVVGADSAASTLRRRLSEMGVANLALVERDGVTTICKTRILDDGTHRQLLRLDIDGEREAFENAAELLKDSVLSLYSRQHVVVLADYDKGTLTDSLLRAVIRACRSKEIPCIGDPKRSSFAPYAGATLIAPNVLETSRAMGRALETEEAVCRAAAELRDDLELDHMLITRGSKGMTLSSSEGISHFSAPVREVADVTGAGDTVVAVLAACLAGGWEIRDACGLAVQAAGIAVSKPGTYVVKAAELDSVNSRISPKVVDRETGRRILSDCRRAGRRVVFTNGCFDILHAGHLWCLERAREQGEFLVVGLNSDVSVRGNKGCARPVIGESHRAALLAGLACVDMVVLFDELTPEELVRALEPDVLVKGGDYDPKTIAGAAFVRAKGGQVLTIPLVDGLSTTSILAAGVAGDSA
jgi:D-beta-D-heptose 7-phosphate kinase/D-beta-D-heptose 1-phosphate adenosyltransferase